MPRAIQSAMATNDEIRSRIEAFASELSALVQQSALEAVKSWRYKPYLLNGDPVEVETQVNVIFTLGG